MPTKGRPDGLHICPCARRPLESFFEDPIVVAIRSSQYFGMESMQMGGLSRHCWTTWMLFLFCSTHPRQRQLPSDRSLQPTFHFSMSSCCFLYCFTNSSSTFFSPSEFVCNAGVTSFTVLSTSTPLIMRKHLRSGGNGPKVSSTSLFRKRSAEELTLNPREGPPWTRVVVTLHILGPIHIPVFFSILFDVSYPLGKLL